MKQVIPEELNKHLDAINEIFSQVASQQSQKAKELEEMGRDALEMEQILKGTLGEAKSKLELAQKRLLEADKRYEKADEISRFFEEVADKENKRLKNLIRKANAIKSDIEAGKATLEQRKEQLKIKEIQVRDKEQALNRKYTEIKAKAKTLGIVI